MIKTILAVFIPAFLTVTTASAADLVLENELFKMTLNQQGVVGELLDKSTGRNYVQGQDAVYFCHVRMYDTEHASLQRRCHGQVREANSRRRFLSLAASMPKF